MWTPTGCFVPKLAVKLSVTCSTRHQKTNLNLSLLNVHRSVRVFFFFSRFFSWPRLNSPHPLSVLFCCFLQVLSLSLFFSVVLNSVQSVKTSGMQSKAVMKWWAEAKQKILGQFTTFACFLFLSSISFLIPPLCLLLLSSYPFIHSLFSLFIFFLSLYSLSLLSPSIFIVFLLISLFHI